MGRVYRDKCILYVYIYIYIYMYQCCKISSIYSRVVMKAMFKIVMMQRK